LLLSHALRLRVVQIARANETNQGTTSHERKVVDTHAASQAGDELDFGVRIDLQHGVLHQLGNV
jgi:hypothetical protein